MYALASLGAPPLLRGRRGTMCTAKGSDVRPGVPWGSASFAWQAWDNVHCQGVGCTPWRPLGLRLFCVAGVGQCALPRGRMYALASLGAPPLLRGRRGAMCTAKGSDVRPGVPWGSASFAWQAWDNVHCQGVGCTPWRPLGLRLFCVAGVGQCAFPRGQMYALASLGAPPLLRGRRGTMCTAKGSDVRPGVPWGSASFAWQAWDNVHCQGIGCAPWRPLGLRRFCVAGVGQCALPRGRMYALASLGAPPLLRGRRGTMCIAKGRMSWQAWDHCALPRGRMYAKGSDVRPGVPWGSASFAWQAWDNVHCQGVGCTPWRPLGLRLFCVAGVGQCALPRGRMYALASLGAPPLCVAGVGQCALPRGLGLRRFCVAFMDDWSLLKVLENNNAAVLQLEAVVPQEPPGVTFMPSSAGTIRVSLKLLWATSACCVPRGSLQRRCRCHMPLGCVSQKCNWRRLSGLCDRPRLSIGVRDVRCGCYRVLDLIRFPCAVYTVYSQRS